MLIILVGFLLCRIFPITSYSTAATVSSANVTCIDYDLNSGPVNAAKGCLQLCCEPQQLYNGNNICISIDEATFFNSNRIEYNNDTAKMLKMFTIAVGKPCNNMQKYEFFDRSNYPHWSSIVELVT